MKLHSTFAIFKGGVVVFYLFMYAALCPASENCTNKIGTIVSLQGSAQLQRGDENTWQAAASNNELCPGDIFRVAADSRATVVLANESVLRINQKSTVTFPETSEDDHSLLELLRGVLHIFSHKPRSLKVVTPYVSGLVEGTEFLVRVDSDKTVITVFEGHVTVVNDQGRLELRSLQSAVAEQKRPPVATTVVNPRDAVAWTLYYPDLVNQQDYPAETPAEKLILQASKSLSVGRVDEVRTLLSEVLRVDPDNGEAYALLSIIETVGNNKEEALGLAQKAVELKPRSAAAALALSYARQARFDLAGARSILRQAARDNPENILVRVRLAELQLSVGDHDTALATALDAASRGPDNGLARTILGFAYLTRIEIDKALTAFRHAVATNPALPLARLGLGLAQIRSGGLEEGRKDIEIAAALDPGNAIIRSYLGKAYYEEKRNRLARRQYATAKELDPADPTPWLYDAIRKQSLNRPVEALHDLQKSMALNDNRAVYRSSLQLDDDLASRSAGLGRIYTDLGFNQLAQVEGLRSAQTDPTNFSAHRFLADIYSGLPRHQISRASELLQSQLLQPLNVNPVQPQLTESDLALFGGAGSSDSSFNDYDQLFVRDDLSLLTSGMIGSHETWGDEIVLSGIRGRFSYSVGQLHLETDGIRENSDWDKDLYTAFLQTALSPATSLMAELRYREDDFGDIAFLFDQANYSRSLRQTEETGSARIGVRHDLNRRSTLLATAIASKDDNSAFTGSDGFSLSVDIQDEAENFMVEAQHIYRRDAFNLQSGAGYMQADEQHSYRILFPYDLLMAGEDETQHFNLYSYGRFDLPGNLLATIGLSGDILESPFRDRKDLNPKLGLTWQPSERTQLRTALFRTVMRRLIYAQTIEPTMVAGFNQYLGDTEASASWNYGLGVDHTFTENIFAGLQLYHRSLDVFFDDSLIQGDPSSDSDEWQEDIGSAYLYWTPFSWASVGLDYSYQQFSHDRFGFIQNIRELTTHRLSSQLQLFHPNGFSSGVAVSYVDQEGEFGDIYTGFTEGDDQFFVVDVSLSYRLPQRYGIFRLEVENLFDEQFRFVDDDPRDPRFVPEQQIVASLTIAF